MNIPTLTTLLVGALASTTTFAQQNALEEHFASGVFPPANWSLQQSGTQGWADGASVGAAQKAFHNDFSAALGSTNNNLLATMDLDLSAFSGAWLHMENRVRWANFMAHHPRAMADGASTVEASVDGGLTWSVVWNETRTQDGVEVSVVDLSSYAGSSAVSVGFRYVGNFAHEWTIDEVVVNDSPLPPPPPGVFWNVELPTTFAQLPFSEDFDTVAGVVPSYMGLTAEDPLTGLPSAVAWCNIGQQGPMTGTPWSGAYNLEMGLDPNVPGGTYVRNALVIGLDNTTAQLGNLQLSLRAADFGEELDAIDGIWLSNDGSNWYPLASWAGAGASNWAAMNGINLSDAPIQTPGTFYLMFAQEDNYPYANQDGIGVDDIVVSGDPPPSPLMSVSGTCPGYMTVSADGCTPNGNVAFGWSHATGSALIPTGACIGTLTALDSPTLAGVAVANNFGSANWIAQVPAGACGTVFMQAVDMTTCIVSPTINF